jgi:hypothetical protein
METADLQPPTLKCPGALSSLPHPPLRQVHSDIKARNVLLKTSQTDDGRGYVAKGAVGDAFGGTRSFRWPVQRACGPGQVEPARAPVWQAATAGHASAAAVQGGVNLQQNVSPPAVADFGLSLQLPEGGSHLAGVFQVRISRAARWWALSRGVARPPPSAAHHHGPAAQRHAPPPSHSTPCAGHDDAHVSLHSQGPLASPALPQLSAVAASTSRDVTGKHESARAFSSNPPTPRPPSPSSRPNPDPARIRAAGRQR